MAKYTILFMQYLEDGNPLPDSFSLIDGFSDLFKKRYCDHEIGFETEGLFYMKLDLKASLVIPKYAERIAKLASAWLEFDSPAKVYYEISNSTANVGKQKTKLTDLPINATTAEPNSVTESDPYENGEERESTRRETGASGDEAIRRLEFLNKDVSNIMEKCLDEFKTLFMQVY